MVKWRSAQGLPALGTTSHFIVKKERLMSDSNSTTNFCNKCQCETDRYESGKCKACVKAYNKKWWTENETYAATYRTDHPDAVKAAQKKYKTENKAEIASRKKDAKEKDPEKFAAYSRKYYYLNRAAILQKTQAWRLKNIDKVKASHAKWGILNLENIRIYAAKRRVLYPFLDRTYYQNRKARKLKTGGRLSKGLSQRLFLLQKGKCACCNQPLGGDFHMDHIMPLALGGSNSDDNIQLLRKTCNLQKQASHPIDFMQRRGFLL